MEFTTKSLKSENPLTDFSYVFIEFKYIETRDLKSINLVILNRLFKFIKYKS